MQADWPPSTAPRRAGDRRRRRSCCRAGHIERDTWGRRNGMNTSSGTDGRGSRETEGGRVRVWGKGVICQRTCFGGRGFMLVTLASLSISWDTGTSRMSLHQRVACEATNLDSAVCTLPTPIGMGTRTQRQDSQDLFEGQVLLDRGVAHVQHGVPGSLRAVHHRFEPLSRGDRCSNGAANETENAPRDVRGNK